MTRSYSITLRDVFKLLIDFFQVALQLFVSLEFSIFFVRTLKKVWPRSFGRRQLASRALSVPIWLRYIHWPIWWCRWVHQTVCIFSAPAAHPLTWSSLAAPRRSDCHLQLFKVVNLITWQNLAKVSTHLATRMYQKFGGTIKIDAKSPRGRDGMATAPLN